MDYLWLKAVHVSAVLIFVGGLFTQAMGVVAGARGNAETVALVSRWDQRVTMPAMLVVWLTGATAAATAGLFSDRWLWAKLVFVIALSGLHGVQSGRLRRLRRGEQSSLGSPLAASVGIAFSVVIIALLVVTKPF